MKRLALPLMLLVIGLSMLVGCFYVPGFEHKTTLAQVDFRKLIGDANSQRPIRPFHITREQVVALLGPPWRTSVDGRATDDLYVLESEHGVWVWPLCFYAQPAYQKQYTAHLLFGADNMLERVQLDQGEIPLGPFVVP